MVFTSAEKKTKHHCGCIVFAVSDTIQNIFQFTTHRSNTRLSTCGVQRHTHTHLHTHTYTHSFPVTVKRGLLQDVVASADAC